MVIAKNMTGQTVSNDTMLTILLYRWRQLLFEVEPFLRTASISDIETDTCLDTAIGRI